jgi:serine protease AprX
LARAARSAVAAGIVVVAAAGNAGQDATGREVYGTVPSPGHDPSVITVGATNAFGTSGRSDDAVTGFSSRGPTRGHFSFSNGRDWIDNLIKPDLVAPGNKILAAMASGDTGAPAGWNALVRAYPSLAQIPGAATAAGQTLMQLSGTSVSTPAVSGAVALMLQANPGLTAPLIKAILQYTAQPIAGANVLQQGTGQLNVVGAVTLARALRTDVAGALRAGTLKAGDNLLALGATLPTASSTLGTEVVPWARVSVVGGGRLVTGDALFRTFQPIYDPKLTWVRHLVLRSTLTYAPANYTLPSVTSPKRRHPAPRMWPCYCLARAC